MAKVNVSSFTLKGCNVQYGRQISKRLTAALSYASIPFKSLAFQSTIKNHTQDAAIEVGLAKIGTSVVTPKIRYSAGKKGAYRGFYLAPYARILTYEMQVNVTFDSESSRKTAFSMVN